ncbi:hypothetical protein KIH39_14970 [Telmatocola sphagniphila]|jgi:hypothetical protein|uniref:Uncharacterized protein n=1 Tax=Telmatocola sphagniphila TaxID=1123043 RepID=A0A8E6B4D7_9BACT|nr:hypothetical protein [Telmatocola sphagniphila]QVL30155.1 hypothetical protein KIH39_14970 [Telmatocola sphagniphila]
MRIYLIALIFTSFLSSGCALDELFTQNDKKVERLDHPFPTSNLPPAALINASRVDTLGRKILGTNPDIKVNPLFLTVGLQTQSIYHTGLEQVIITEGLVQRCKNDAELAVLLCNELALMEFSRQAANEPEPRPRGEPPLAPPITGDRGGYGGMGSDMTRMAELAKWEERNPRRDSSPRRPNPQNIEDSARSYAIKAGISPEEFSQALPLVKFAQTNAEKEKGKMGN